MVFYNSEVYIASSICRNFCYKLKVPYLIVLFVVSGGIARGAGWDAAGGMQRLPTDPST